ncbi:uncharacterized protein FOMMEDRAFT_160262 [Fomitiporia mediterranea MF3/22]|uniref:uncharacterized protein n=1 Tax=Fomitiporia mediterranea (strain MF3/22) TaxID=694068 RepID=UPI00044092F1|nr:uncharacterized protein FOMMEDRAFT_160262 [Fomitiporia mediterranea MF3/22]EJC99818.1 hypothetical protein FOMMEDRAFT_160262 [Fomitiporia mediterranea MF3/22]
MLSTCHPFNTRAKPPTARVVHGFLVLQYVNAVGYFKWIIYGVAYACAFSVIRRDLKPANLRIAHKALYYFKQITYGLAYAHTFSATRRNLQPENMLIANLKPLNVENLYYSNSGEFFDYLVLLFPVLECVYSGEIFDYLVSFGRIEHHKALCYFKNALDKIAICTPCCLFSCVCRTYGLVCAHALSVIHCSLKLVKSRFYHDGQPIRHYMAPPMEDVPESPSEMISDSAHTGPAGHPSRTPQIQASRLAPKPPQRMLANGSTLEPGSPMISPPNSRMRSVSLSGPLTLCSSQVARGRPASSPVPPRDVFVATDAETAEKMRSPRDGVDDIHMPLRVILSCNTSPNCAIRTETQTVDGLPYSQQRYDPMTEIPTPGTPRDVPPWIPTCAIATDVSLSPSPLL